MEATRNSGGEINFDATFNQQNKKSCSGILVRDSKGQVLHFKVFINTKIPTAFAAEALSCVQETEFGIDLVLERVMIEGDSLTVIKKLQSTNEDNSEIRAYTFSAKILSSGFKACLFKHATRQANKGAHVLAQEGLQSEEVTYLQNRLPKAVEMVVDDEYETVGRNGGIFGGLNLIDEDNGRSCKRLEWWKLFRLET
ncbi:hypothetical protein Goklo_029718 [Gossypium klotzschianum]|uniref:RNase H type-1 domain-containing protein n=1 Tax=Gossypium klotzschianum TaxID=34286 RepID=A0A7J8WEJ5_9ROSI|nr:hypothetical protein [Gossypium klotzschianum]